MLQPCSCMQKNPGTHSNPQPIHAWVSLVPPSFMRIQIQATFPTVLFETPTVSKSKRPGRD
eukprot:2027140-Rhodomonas_salina.1